MEVQNLENQKPNTDQVVLFMDQQTPKLKDTPPPPQSDSTTTITTGFKSFRPLNLSKPKSRFAEIKYPPPPTKSIPESEELQPLNPHETSSDEEDDDEEWFENIEGDYDDEEHSKYKKRRKRKVNKRALIEFTLFLVITTCLICSLTLESVKNKTKWGIEIWKWCLLVLVLFCGRLVSGWVVGFLVFLIEKNFMLREKVLYFVYGLRKSFQNCVWLGLALIAWMIMFHEVHKHNKVLKKVFRFLIAVLIGATVWLLKIVLVKVLASSFHVATFFDRMKESVFHHYILDALSGPPLDEDERETPRRKTIRHSKTLPARLKDRSGPLTPSRSKKYGPGKIDMERLKKLSLHSRATAWSVKRLVSSIRSTGLSTISRTVDDFGNGESEISSEWEARSCAQRIFKHVAKTGAK